ncbi:MAG: DUF255 domain-containing protein [Cyclobacteriaceae bacterium]|nr:DUF255 domain-containing protein [Cyclobacteriaceae bacterium]
MIKKTPLIFIILVLFTSFNTRKEVTNSNSKVNWLTFEEAVEKSKTEKRKIVIDVYTDWCGYCKVMDKNTFNNEHIAEYMNSKFYPVKLNAEQTKNIQFRGNTFTYVNNRGRGYHQLAFELLQGKLSYPTTVFLDENFNMIQPLPGYQKPQFFDMVLKYFGENHFKNTKWSEFEKNYQSPFNS